MNRQRLVWPALDPVLASNRQGSLFNLADWTGDWVVLDEAAKIAPFLSQQIAASMD